MFKKIMMGWLLSALISVTAHASDSVWVPVGGFAQLGVGDNQTHSYLLGALWDLPWQRHYSWGKLTLHGEVALGQWRTELAHEGRTRNITQVSLTPTVRWQPRAQRSPWFVDIGIGLNYIAPRFRSDNRRFSTDFNFGDHLGVGYRLPTQRRQELILRIEHFSNAGIDHPNPGENFGQLRYSVFFGKP